MNFLHSRKFWLIMVFILLNTNNKVFADSAPIGNLNSVILNCDATSYKSTQQIDDNQNFTIKWGCSFWNLKWKTTISGYTITNNSQLVLRHRDRYIYPHRSETYTFNGFLGKQSTIKITSFTEEEFKMLEDQ
jgi:hypothetical protein